MTMLELIDFCLGYANMEFVKYIGEIMLQDLTYESNNTTS